MGEKITEFIQAEEEKERFLHDLGERVKEINCLYGLSKLVEQADISLEEIFRGTADLNSSSWQYPDITCARVVFENKEFKTHNFRITKWKQSADVRVYGKTAGTIEVYYLEEKPEFDEVPFLKEERNLLDAIAKQLGSITEHKKAEEALKVSKEFSEDLIASMKDGFSVLDKDGVHIDVNPALCRMTGFSRAELIATGPPHLYWPEEEYENIKKAFQKTLRGEFEDFELVFKRKNGERFPVIVSPSQVTDKEENVISYFATVKDISRHKEVDEELKKYRYQLEELVEKRTAELKNINERLQQEIMERKKAEGEAIRTKEYLQNIINSASEVVISFDNNNRVTTWNKTAELLTGFKQREVVGRNVTKLPAFNNLREVLDNLKSISYGKKHGFDDLVLRTKDNAKRIIKVSCSAIKSDKDQPIGVLCVGKDITRDVESHGKLLKGNSYFISDKSNRSALEFFVGLTIISGYKGLFITRATPDIIKSMIPSKDIQVALLSQEKMGGFDNIQDLDGLIAMIEEFSRKNTDSVVLLDRVDYLLTIFSFEQFAQTLYQINNIISKNRSILLLHLNPSVVDSRKLAIIEEELQPLPSQKIEDIHLKDELYDILKFIYEQNQKNAVVSFKQIRKELSIVNKTTAKRLRMLENNGLIFIKKQGRMKTLHTSDKGKTLLHKRQVI